MCLYSIDVLEKLSLTNMLVLFSLILNSIFWPRDVESLFMEPSRRCVPTSVIHGQCLVCVCSPDGIFHCSAKLCTTPDPELVKQGPRWAAPIRHRDCEANMMFTQKSLICTCTNSGHWRSFTCKNTFHDLRLRRHLLHPRISPNIACSPNAFYIVDCNICQCAPNGNLPLDSCSNRLCMRGTKADRCDIGDYIRTNEEFCSCSQFHYYVDHLCFPVHEKPAQIILKRSLEGIMDIDRSWATVNSSFPAKCESKMHYTVDCKECVCINGKMACKGEECKAINVDGSENSNNLRYKKPHKSTTNFKSLPVIENERQRCRPGREYRINCNTCVCSNTGRLYCTSNICLDEVDIDPDMLRSALLTHQL